MIAKVGLSIPASQFNDDFLECEVANGLGVKGDSLPNHIKSQYISNRQKNSNSILFGSNMYYMCKRKGNDVILVGTNSN